MTGSSRNYLAVATVAVAEGEEVHCGHPAGELLVDEEAKEIPECPSYTPVEVYDALRLRIAGWECGEMALETGLSSREVAALVRTYTDGLVAVREGLKKRNHHKGAHGGARPAAGRPCGLTGEQRARILQLHSEGLRYVEIAKVVGCTEGQARYIAEAGR